MVVELGGDGGRGGLARRERGRRGGRRGGRRHRARGGAGGQRRGAVVDRPGDGEHLARLVVDLEPLVVGHAAVARAELLLGQHLLRPGSPTSASRGSWWSGGAVVGGAVVGGAVVGAQWWPGRRWWAAQCRRCSGGRRRHHGDGGRRRGRGGDRRLAVVVVSGTVVTVVTGASVVLTGGLVGTATSLSLVESPPRRAKNDTRPMAQRASTAPAVMRAAVTSCSPLRVPRDRRMESEACCASTKATIVPMSGMTMLTTAHTIAAIREGLGAGLLAPTTRAALAARRTWAPAPARAGRCRCHPLASRRGTGLRAARWTWAGTLPSRTRVLV